jgi:hypothetical protein
VISTVTHIAKNSKGAEARIRQAVIVNLRDQLTSCRY